MGQGLWDAPAQCENTMREKVIKYSNGSGGEQEAWGGGRGCWGRDEAAQEDLTLVKFPPPMAYSWNSSLALLLLRPLRRCPHFLLH